MAGVTGLEPATSGVTGRHSNQLSYTPAGPYRTARCLSAAPRSVLVSGELGEAFGEVKRPFPTFVPAGGASAGKPRNPHEIERKFPFGLRLWTASAAAPAASAAALPANPVEVFFLPSGHQRSAVGSRLMVRLPVAVSVRRSGGTGPAGTQLAEVWCSARAGLPQKRRLLSVLHFRRACCAAMIRRAFARAESLSPLDRFTASGFRLAQRDATDRLVPRGVPGDAEPACAGLRR